MSQYATKGDEIASIEQKKAELENENLILTRQIAEAKNLDYIKKEATADNSNYVAITSKEVNYLTLSQ